jgi:flagellar motor protein MotB
MIGKSLTVLSAVLLLAACQSDEEMPAPMTTAAPAPAPMAARPGFPTVVLTIEGHADERGTREYNLALGARRAQAVRDYLVSLGISGARIDTISYGKERPMCVQSDEGCWAQNRRGLSTIKSGAVS